MITLLFSGAYQLDVWLHQHVGRFYAAILGWGLVFSIFGAVSNLSQTVKSGASLLKIAALVVLQLALLINQLAQLYERRQARRAAKTPASA
jgi:predicted nuclease of restriction endonuclease-like RecB superfamily